LRKSDHPATPNLMASASMTSSHAPAVRQSSWPHSRIHVTGGAMLDELMVLYKNVAIKYK
jgi:hypothetical protein